MKTINMKKITMAISLPLFFAACGDNVTDNDPVATQAYEDTEAFPDCDESYEGMFATVTSSKELYICTAEKWVNLSKAGADSKSAAKSGCSAKELADKSGVQITCNGEAVGTLKYGKAGSAGSTGATGPKGTDGAAGSDGQSYSGTDAKWDTDRCKLKNAGYDYMIYQCGDSTYVTQLSKSTTSSTPWKAFNTSLTVSNYNGYAPAFVIYTGFEGASGSLKYFEGETPLTETTSLVAKHIISAGGTMGGTASIEITKAQTVTAAKYRPFVGAKFTYSTSTSGANIGNRAGVCMLYSSEKEMNLLLAGETGFLKAALPATKDGKDTLVQLLWRDFEPVADGADINKVIAKANYAFIEAVGGTEVGKLENNFAIHQFGDYGRCTDETVDTWVASFVTETGTVKDAVDNKIEYKTVTIGERTWLAENLRSGTGKCLLATQDDANCSKYGRKYTWVQALGSDATKYGCSSSAVCTSTLPTSGVQGICPEGWRLTKVSDWTDLLSVLAKKAGVSSLSGSANKSLIIPFALFEKGGKMISTVTYFYAVQNVTGLSLVFDGDGYYWNYAESSTSASAVDWDWNDMYPYYYGSTTLSKISEYPVRCVKDATP